MVVPGEVYNRWQASAVLAHGAAEGGFTLPHTGRFAVVFVLLAVMLPSLAVGRSKSVFRGQAVEWTPDLIGGDESEPLSFRPAWTFEGFAAPLAGDPAAIIGGLVGAARDGEVVALDASSGRSYWRVRLPGPLPVGPVSAHGVIYQAAGDGRLYALDGTDGGILWAGDLGADAVARPAAFGNSLLVPTAAEALIAVDRQSGKVEARHALPGRATASVAIAEGVIVLGTDLGTVVAFDAGNMDERWRRDLGHPITSPPLIHKRRVYLGAQDNSLHCLRLKNGKRKWAQGLGSIVSARLFVREKNLYALCYDNDIYVMRYRNGHLIGRLRLGHRLDRSAGMSAGHLFVVPYTASTLVELSLPGLRSGGRFSLDRPGEWFTTSPVVFEQRLALGYGRDEGRIIALDMVSQAAGEGAEVAESVVRTSQP